MTKRKNDAATAAPVAATVAGIASAVLHAAKGGRAAARVARQLWGEDWAARLGPKSDERQAFNAAYLAALEADPEHRPMVVIRDRGEYRLPRDGEDVTDGLTLTVALCAQYAGNALTKLKSECPTLGGYVAACRKYYSDAAADGWRNLKDADASLDRINALGQDKSGTAGQSVAPFAERMARDLEKRIIAPNAVAFGKGDPTSFPPDVMSAAIDAFMARLNK